MSQPALFSEPPRYPCVFSPCRRYRYLLRSVLGSGKGVCLWIMANPSVAAEFKLDPTLTRCENFTRAWGFAEMRVVNVRAWVATDPKSVPADPLAIGPENNERIIYEAARAKLVVAGWGELAGERGPRVLALLRDVGVTPHALRLTKAGNPGHPLYLPASLKPFPMEAT